MQYLKRNTKFGILAFLVIILSITISISTLAKTEVYPACACLHADRFYLYDNPQILSTTSLKSEVQIININTVSQDELIKILKISEPLARKIITLRDSLNGRFKDPQDLIIQLPEITTLDWQEWEEEGIIITIN
ncbi:MAG: helix-hairpin-helix domain-containing protein [Atribacterota bacterium]|nr:helix-hairpin-helix domain-containing protein [Atribacterota bacterium]